MTDYVADNPKHVVIQGDSWRILYLDLGQHLATSKPFEAFDNREDAVQLMLQHDPGFEDDWEGTKVPESVSSGKFWVALYDVDPALCQQAQGLVDQDPRLRLAAQHEWVINRSSPSLRQVQEALGVSNEYIDALFRKAIKIEL